MLPIPLLGSDQVQLDLRACFEVAYDRIGADASCVDALLRGRGLRS